MSDKMRLIPFRNLIHWIFEEYEQDKTIFGIPETKFFQKRNEDHIEIFGDVCETPVGPAAGPHTQLAQNIIASYLTGARFFELKTVQKLDCLEFPKPCILARDEGYNTEWSTELSIEGAYEEYVKSWFILHIFQKIFNLSLFDTRSFVFNMSVGYDLAGIKTEKVNDFIEGLKNASNNDFFNSCKTILKDELENGILSDISEKNDILSTINDFIDGISPNICNSITLSTMHGCPPEEIDSICKYLIKEKKLNTYVKLNPTLLGFEFVRSAFAQMGFDYIELKEASFTHDLQYVPAIEMVKNLVTFAEENGQIFGVKLSNTLPVKITRKELPGEEMYMSGRALYPLTINLADKLSKDFDGLLKISYSGGADNFNIKAIFETGIQPITVATTLLKPGGYQRFNQLAGILENHLFIPKKIDMEKLAKLAKGAIDDFNHQKEARYIESRKLKQELPQLDCFIAPCSNGCPINQDIPEYIRFVNEEKYVEALGIITAKNPLPFITGFICDHNCQLKCTRIDYEESVMIRDMKRIAAENGFEEFYRKFNNEVEKNHIKVAIIGAGAAGLSSAYFLLREGFDVTIYDKADKPGGMVKHGIPNFRIPDWAIENDIELIKKAGVKFELGVDENFSVEILKNHDYKYILLGIGAWKSRELHLEKNDGTVLNAIKFLQNYKIDSESQKLGKNVAVIGGGNSAMDGARAAKCTKGVEKVHIIYRRTQNEMPADREEYEEALHDGIIFKDLLLPVEFTDGILKCQKMKLGQSDASGRRSPIPIFDEFEEIKIDTVITAIGELVDYDILKKNGIEISDKGNIKTDTNSLETNIENVFVMGDAYRGPATVVEAIADATKITKAIFKKESIADYESKFIPEIELDKIKQTSKILDKKSLIIKAFDKELADYSQNESNRCLECNIVCNICTEVCPNRANIAINISNDLFNDANQIIHIDGMCNECGNCSIFCPYDGYPYKDKFILFWTEEDFEDNENEGFLLINNQRQPEFKIRYDKDIFVIKFISNEEIFSEKDIKAIPDFEKITSLIWTVFQKHSYLLTIGDK
ncbi:MAG: putative selenate reductase subunit YgfK [Candidatus Cloacimonetes bacterium]|nr:putative selenate reductase subunit YgfK [Candidatus Cloacimonadota bacterium]